MKFQFVVQRMEAGRYQLFIENLTTSDVRLSRCLLATGASVQFLKTKAESLFSGFRGLHIQWCDGDDPNYDSTEYFEIL